MFSFLNQRVIVKVYRISSRITDHTKSKICNTKVINGHFILETGSFHRFRIGHRRHHRQSPFSSTMSHIYDVIGLFRVRFFEGISVIFENQLIWKFQTFQYNGQVQGRVYSVWARKREKKVECGTIELEIIFYWNILLAAGMWQGLKYLKFSKIEIHKITQKR